MTDVVDIYDPKLLPPFTVMFPNDLDAALKRLKNIEDKLERRGYRVHRPLVIHRRHLKGGAMLSVQLDKMDESS